MIKKVICLLSTISLLFMLTACGGATNTTAEAVENTTTVDAPTEETKEVVETPTPEPTSEPAEVSTSDELKDTEDVYDGVDEEWAANKLQKVKESFDTLMNDNGTKEPESRAFFCLYLSDYQDLPPIEGLKTSDGLSFGKDTTDLPSVVYCYFDVLANYFYNSINKDEEYFDFGEYISSHSSEDMSKFMTKAEDDIDPNEGAFNSNNISMYNMLWIPALGDGKMTLQNITDDISVAHTKILLPDLSYADVVYQCDIYMDDKDTGLKAVFDKDGNLLNLNDENAQIELVVPFE